jgi:outer membrane receptor for ferrienterochelin and colicins
MESNKGTATDTNGVFQLRKDSEMYLVVSYIGYKSDTLHIHEPSQLKVILANESSKILQEVVVEGTSLSSFLSNAEPLNTRTMTEKELFKAACCNLSESFETNPSVDVNYADAVSGAKQIQMLGLSGIYTQLTYENMPGARGLASNFGLGYVPGTWVESIQVTKGVGSAVNGYESAAGQINVELKKTEISPKTGERLYFNTYCNDFGRYEANLNFTQKLSAKWGTATLFHYDQQSMRMDQNRDGFLDIPLGNQYNGMVRWKYDNGKGLVSLFGIKALKDERTGGQWAFDKTSDRLTKTSYGLGLNTERLEVFGKLGYVFPQKKYKSIGFMTSALTHANANYFGLTSYNAGQKTLYANLIYQSIIGTTNHKFRTGASYLADAYDEDFIPWTYSLGQNFKRTELVPGMFYEHTWTASSKFTTIVALRADYHNLFGFFLTPRVHGKYQPTPKTTIRFSAGRGQRTANIFAENNSVFVSSRKAILPNVAAKAYGLDPEVAWNYGISLNQDFKFNYREGNITFDFYRTDFQNQVVVDLDKNPQAVSFYNLKGISYSNSVQVEVQYSPAKRLELRTAYRFYDVKTTYFGTLLSRPLVAKHRAFANIAYPTRNSWKIDFTANWNGPKRIPSTASNPENYRFEEYSPGFFIFNCQLSKSVGKPEKQWLDLYMGVENVGDFRQNQAIISNDSPFGPYFDSSLVWGPITGRMVYAGVRYKLK